MEAVHPIPNSHPQAEENHEVNYAFLTTNLARESLAQGRWSEGPSLDGKGQFSIRRAEPMGGEPQLAPSRPGGGAQVDQMEPGGVVNRVKQKRSGD